MWSVPPPPPPHMPLYMAVSFSNKKYCMELFVVVVVSIFIVVVVVVIIVVVYCHAGLSASVLPAANEPELLCQADL